MSNEGKEPLENDSGMLEVVAGFLTELGWAYEPTGDQMLAFGYQGNHGQWLCYAHCRPETDHFLFYSVAPVRVPEVLRPPTAEFLTRANWGLLLGNFELDYADGEIRYKTSIQLNGAALTAALLHPLIFGNLVVMDRYLPGIEAVIALRQTPGEAIHTVEAASTEA